MTLAQCAYRNCTQQPVGQASLQRDVGHWGYHAPVFCICNVHWSARAHAESGLSWGARRRLEADRWRLIRLEKGEGA